MNQLTLDHVAMILENVDESITFYKEVLGYKEKGVFTSKDGRIFTYLENNGIVYEFFERKGIKTDAIGKIDHIAYESKDIYKDYEYYKAKGCLANDSGVNYIDFLWDNGVDYFFIVSPNNEMIEFCQKR